LYSNEDEPAIGALSEVTPLPRSPRDSRLLVRSTLYGTGNIQEWSIVDVHGNDLRRLEERIPLQLQERLLEPGETIRKQYGTGVRILPDGKLESAVLVYREGAPNCCPTGAMLTAREVVGENAISIERVWREAFPERLVPAAVPTRRTGASPSPGARQRRPMTRVTCRRPSQT
jgi:hypothetical protein